MKDKNIQELIDLYHSGKLAVVEKKVIKLIKKYPNSFILYNLFGAILADQKNLEEAVINYRKSIQINPDYAEGYNNLGSVLYKLEKFNESAVSLQKAIQIKPNFAEAYNNLGLTLNELGKLNKSIDCYQRAIKIKSNFVEAHNNLGLIFEKLGQLNKSIDSYQRAIQIKPDYAEAHNNLGITFKELGRLSESIASYQRAIQIKPDYAEAYSNLGATYKILGQLNKSIDCYQRAIKIKPDYVEAYNNFGNVLKANEKVDEAIFNYEKAIKINANYAEAYGNLGNLLKEIGRVDDAHNCYHKLFNLKPDDIEYRINNGLLITPIVQSVEEINCYRDEYIKNLESLKKYKFVSKKPGVSLNPNFFQLAYHNKDNLEIMKRTSNLFKQIILNINYVSKRIKKDKKQKKIKIGFISEFLTTHTIGKLFGGLIKNIDRKKFDVTIIHTLETKESLIKNEIDDSANKVVNLSSRIQEQQQQIEKENLDIIFYPDIGMSPRTYFLAFSRLAPVQIVSWGHPETTGIDTIDYFLSSALFESDNAEKKYSERLICLNEFPLYYEPPKNIGLLKNRSDLKLPENARLYACPQSLFKLHPDFDAILAKILEQDPEGHIVLIGGEGKYKFWSESLKKRWSKNFPVLNKRVLFTNRLSLLEFVSLCNCVDVLLDPMHFGGGNTFLESMIVGTPTVTMPGTHLKANITAAAYKQMKISNPPIVKNSKEYIDLAIQLAKDSKKNHSLRKDLKNAANKYLYKSLKTLKQFEQFLEEAHKASQLGNKLKDGYIIN